MAARAVTRKSTHVLPFNGSWLVRHADGAKTGTGEFPTQKEALEHALRFAKSRKAAKVLVHSRQGRIRTVYRRGIPKMPKLPYKSSLDPEALRRAVAEVVRARLLRQ